MFPREPLFQSEITDIGKYNNDYFGVTGKLSPNNNIYYNDPLKEALCQDISSRTEKQCGYAAGGHTKGLSTNVLDVQYVARDEWNRIGSVGQRLHVYILNQTESYPLEREYIVTYNTESASGKVMMGCSSGDVTLGVLVGVAVQGGGIVAQQGGNTQILDTGYTPLMMAQVQCQSFECSGSDYEVSETLSSQYPYARISQAVIISPVIAQWSHGDTLNAVHNVNLHCYGVGNGYVTNLESYCSVIEPENEPIDFGLNPVYQDRGCVFIDSLTIGDFQTPAFNICARVITFGNLNIFGISINLDLIARFMMVVAALFLILR